MIGTKQLGPFTHIRLLQILISLKKNFILKIYLNNRIGGDIELAYLPLTPKLLPRLYGFSRELLLEERFCYKEHVLYDQ